MTDYIDYLTADEKPNAKLMIQRLSEAGKCIISGETEDLVEMPVDMNPDNVLANNMACITKTLARESLYTSFYTVSVKDFEVTFCTAPAFQNYNIELCSLLDKDDGPEAAEALKMDGYDFTKIYAYLTARHCKGITRVLVPDKVGSYMEWNQYLGFVMRSRIRMKASGIIKPPTLVSV